MPNRIFSTVIGAVFFCIPTACAVPMQAVQQADSLFATGRYLAAYELYTQQSHGLQRLLRMAYIQEGLQDYPRALYHLMDYYSRTQDARVWERIVTLSKAHNMAGYQLEEEERVLLWILSYKQWLFVISGLLWVFFVGLCLVRGRQQTWRAAGLLFFSISLIGLLERKLWLPQRAVVLESGVGLYAGPSGAAPLRLPQGLPPGALLHVQQRHAIWTRVQWQGQPGYVRTHQLGLLHYD